MEEISRFRVRDTMGNKYEIVEYVDGDRTEYRTPDGHKVERLDRANFVIHRRNPRTHEPTIEVYR